MQRLVVHCLNPSATTGVLVHGPLRFPCVFGRSGRRVRKREGDGATPVGWLPLRDVFFRADRISRPRYCGRVRAIRSADGWCDDPLDRNYNRLVQLPYGGRTESLCRTDGLYDLVGVLGYNDRPRARGAGSAIFLHCADPALRPTEGCIALRRTHLERLLALLPASAKIGVGIAPMPVRKHTARERQRRRS